jgi:hypothetical protein
MSSPDLPDAFGEGDAQDGAEAFDEDVLDAREGLSEMRTFEELPDLLDVTRADGDSDADDTPDADAFDEEDDELHYRAAVDEFEDGVSLDPADDQPGAATASDEVQGGEDGFTDFQSGEVSDEDLKAMGYSEDRGGAVRAKPD